MALSTVSCLGIYPDCHCEDPWPSAEPTESPTAAPTESPTSATAATAAAPLPAAAQTTAAQASERLRSAASRTQQRRRQHTKKTKRPSAATNCVTDGSVTVPLAARLASRVAIIGSQSFRDGHLHEAFLDDVRGRPSSKGCQPWASPASGMGIYMRHSWTTSVDGCHPMDASRGPRPLQEWVST